MFSVVELPSHSFDIEMLMLPMRVLIYGWA
jgi:hypothetical protein